MPPREEENKRLAVEHSPAELGSSRGGLRRGCSGIRLDDRRAEENVQGRVVEGKYCLRDRMPRARERCQLLVVDDPETLARIGSYSLGCTDHSLPPRLRRLSRH